MSKIETLIQIKHFDFVSRVPVIVSLISLQSVSSREESGAGFSQVDLSFQHGRLTE